MKNKEQKKNADFIVSHFSRMRHNLIKSGGRRGLYIPVKGWNFFVKSNLLLFFITSRIPFIQSNQQTLLQNIYSIILLSISTTKTVLLKQSQELYWLQDIYIYYHQNICWLKAFSNTKNVSLCGEHPRRSVISMLQSNSLKSYFRMGVLL